MFPIKILTKQFPNPLDFPEFPCRNFSSRKNIANSKQKKTKLRASKLVVLPVERIRFFISSRFPRFHSAGEWFVGRIAAAAACLPSPNVQLPLAYISIAMNKNNLLWRWLQSFTFQASARHEAAVLLCHDMKYEFYANAEDEQEEEELFVIFFCELSNYFVFWCFKLTQ